MRQATDITYALQHIASLLTKQADQVLHEQLGIGMSQFRILRMLEAKPQVTQQEIAIDLGQTEASISRQIKLMLHDGLLKVSRSPKDRREHITVLTQRGERLSVAADEVLNRYYQPVLVALGEKRLEQFDDALEAVHQTVCQVAHP